CTWAGTCSCSRRSCGGSIACRGAPPRRSWPPVSAGPSASMPLRSCSGSAANAGASSEPRGGRPRRRAMEPNMHPRNLIATIHPRLAVVLHDLAMTWLAWVAANWLRYSFEPNPPPLTWFTPEIGLAVAAQGLVLWWTGLYKGLWRFASLPDLWNIVRAGVL